MKQSSRLGRVSSVAGVVAFILVGAASAARADLGDKGVVSISVDRLFGFNQIKATTSSNNMETNYTRSDFSLFVPAIYTPYSTPRLALDVAIGERVTLGGAIGITISSTSGNRTFSGLTVESPSGDGTGIVLAPRAGYIIPLGSAKLWLRGGITFFQNSNKTNSPTGAESSVHGLALDLEPTFVFMVAPHLGVTVGAVIDLPLSGESKTTIGSASNSTDTSIRNLGVVAGLALPF
jgi:hypothetical protein